MSAHEIWATAENSAAGQPLVAILGYAVGLPAPEEIAADRLPIFFPLEVVNSKGEKLALKPGDANNKAVAEKPVENGAFLITMGYKPTFWSCIPSGSVMKPKSEAPGAAGCERYSRSAKGAIAIGGVSDDFVDKPVGTKLEIVANPAVLKAAQEPPLQALFDGQPLKGAEINGILAGNRYAEEGNRDFHAKTDNNGKLVFVRAKGGLWTLMVEVKSDPDKAVCGEEAGEATLTFTVN